MKSSSRYLALNSGKGDAIKCKHGDGAEKRARQMGSPLFLLRRYYLFLFVFCFVVFFAMTRYADASIYNVPLTIVRALRSVTATGRFTTKQKKINELSFSMSIRFVRILQCLP